MSKLNHVAGRWSTPNPISIHLPYLLSQDSTKVPTHPPLPKFHGSFWRLKLREAKATTDAIFLNGQTPRDHAFNLTKEFLHLTMKGLQKNDNRWVPWCSMDWFDGRFKHLGLVLGFVGCRKCTRLYLLIPWLFDSCDSFRDMFVLLISSS